MYSILPLSFVLLLLLASPAQAQGRYIQENFQPFLTRGETTWSVSAGVREADIDWNVAATESGAGSPNILFEQEWTNVLTFEVEAGARHIEPLDIGFIKGGLLIEGAVSGGYTLDGDGRLSTYNGDNRTLEAARQTYSNISGDAIGANIAVGYKINLTGTPGYDARRIMMTRRPRTSRGQLRRLRALNRAIENAGPYLSVTPIVGLAVDQQTYEREDAYQHIATADLEEGPFHTYSEFVTNWYGPFIGLEGELKTRKNMLRFRGELHDVTYYAKGYEPSRADDWEQDPSYDHEGDGKAYLMNMEYAYALGEDYALTLDATYRRRELEDGTYKLYIRDSEPLVLNLNEVNDTSKSLRVGVRYNW